MKKIIAMLLSAVLLSFALVSCDEFDPDYWKDKYGVQDTTVYNVYYDFYVITEDGTDEPAKVTVNDSINQLLKKYNTQVKIHYLTATEYQTALKADVEAGPTDLSNTEFRNYLYGGRIVLINDKSMLDEYNFKDLAPYLESKKFGDLAPDYKSPLLDAAYVNGALYGVPNNRVFGSYDYIQINREIAERKLGVSAQTTLLSITSMDDEHALELKAKIAEYNANNDPGEADLVESDVITLVTDKPYEYKQTEEAKKVEGTARQQYIVNVARYPVANADEAYASAYGVLPSANKTEAGKNEQGEDIQVVLVDYTDRAMEIIYALNKDKNIRNTLQYGVKGANYTVVDGIVVKSTEEDRVYNMNIEYTGNVFIASYSDVWTADAAKYGLEQNKHSVLGE
ncbi:MAG: hypothetical protein IJ488_01115 [Clostridia bacterium]|nr:hypothetical protein [Clostridia bacterium]